MSLQSAKQKTSIIGGRIKAGETLELGLEILVYGDTEVSITTPVTFFDTTGGAIAATLANGYPGQIKILYMTVDPSTDDAVVTPASFTNGTTITFDAVYEQWIGIFLAGAWWTLITATATVA